VTRTLDSLGLPVGDAAPAPLSATFMAHFGGPRLTCRFLEHGIFYVRRPKFLETGPRRPLFTFTLPMTGSRQAPGLFAPHIDAFCPDCLF